jgi:hypothetical protein
MQHVHEHLQLACRAGRQLGLLQLHLKAHASSGAQQLLRLIRLSQRLQGNVEKQTAKQENLLEADVRMIPVHVWEQHLL